jgi:hypothetical protein
MLDDLEKYHAETLGMVKNTLECAVKGGMSQEYADHLYQSLIACEEWEETFVQYHKVYQYMIDYMMNKERHQLLERLIKGAEMIEDETDPKRKKYLLGIYEEIERKFTEIKAKERGEHG